MVRNGKPDNVITVVIWKKKAVNKCHFIAQQPFFMSYICLSNSHGNIYNYNQTILFIGVYENFIEKDKNPHHLKLRNKRGALVLPDIFVTYVWTCI